MILEIQNWTTGKRMARVREKSLKIPKGQSESVNRRMMVVWHQESNYLVISWQE